MKKIFAVLITLCLLVGTICISAVTVSAEETPTDAVIKVSGMTEDGDLVLYESYTSLAEGWNEAADLAKNHTFMDENGYDYIVVDLLADWKANEKGEFGSGVGFKENTLCIPEKASMILNMNGHTINRAKTSAEKDGEIIFMSMHSELIINGGNIGDDIVEAGKEPGDVKMGTITGGYSKSGAGGIHMDGYGELTLNNVNIIGNNTKNDDGAGIAAYNDSKITMNGGYLSDNITRNGIFICWGGGMFLKNSEATLNNVVISKNEANSGAAAYLEKSKLTLNDCIVENNGTDIKSSSSGDIFHMVDSVITVTGKGEFKNNGKIIPNSHKTDSIFYVLSSDVSIVGDEKVIFTENHTISIFRSDITGGVTCYATNCEFTNNDGTVGPYYPGQRDHDGTEVVYSFTNCKFNNNNVAGMTSYDLYGNKHLKMTLTDCDLGDATFENKEYIKFVDTNAPDGPTGSMFGEGSLTNILVIISLLASATAIFLTLYFNKKNAVPVTATIAEAEETEDEEEENE